MALEELNGFMLYVTDVRESLRMYRQLGFEILHNNPPSFGSVHLGNFLVQFQDKRNPTDPAFRAEALAEPKGGGLFIYLYVKDIDAYYQELVQRGIKPTTAPRDWPTGNREFVVRDPDGYKLVFYEPHGAREIDHSH